MGLSASQARLLSLTSRMSDLELRGQALQNVKVRLSDEGTEASEAYSRALDKQTLTVFSGVDGDGNKTYTDATAENLTTYDPNSIIDDKQRFIKDSQGRLIVSNEVAQAYNNSGGDLETFLNGIKDADGKGYSKFESAAAKKTAVENALISTLSEQIGTAPASGVEGSGVLGSIASTDWETRKIFTQDKNVVQNTYNEQTIQTYTNTKKYTYTKTPTSTKTNLDNLSTYKDDAKTALNTAKITNYSALINNVINLRRGLESLNRTSALTSNPDKQLLVGAQVTNAKVAVDAIRYIPMHPVATGENGFSTNYSDNDIRKAVFGDSSDTARVGGPFSGTEWNANGEWVPPHNAPDGHQVEGYYKQIIGGNKQIILNDLKNSLTPMLTTAGGALSNIFNTKFAGNTDVLNKISNAISGAQSDTQTFYAKKITDYENEWPNFTGHAVEHEDDWNEGDFSFSEGFHRDYYSGAKTLAQNSNNIYMSYKDTDTWFYDSNQVLKTFLNFFDARCAGLDGKASTSASTYTSSISSDKTYRRNYGGTSEAGSYNDTDTDNNGISDGYMSYVSGLIDAIDIDGLKTSLGDLLYTQSGNTILTDSDGPAITGDPVRTPRGDHDVVQPDGEKTQQSSSDVLASTALPALPADSRYDKPEIQGQSVTDPAERVPGSQITTASVDSAPDASGVITTTVTEETPMQIVTNTPITITTATLVTTLERTPYKTYANDMVDTDNSGSNVDEMRESLQAINDTLGEIGSSFTDSQLATYISAEQGLIQVCMGYTNDNTITSTEAQDIKATLEGISINNLRSYISSGTIAETYDYDKYAAQYYEAVFYEIKDNGGCNPQSDDNLKSSAWLQANIDNGTIFLYTKNNKGVFENVSWASGDPTLVEETDDRDVAKAEAEYKVTMSRIETKEKQIDNQMKQIDTEHTATQTEMESLSKVINKNIDRTLKMFDA